MFIERRKIVKPHKFNKCMFITGMVLSLAVLLGCSSSKQSEESMKLLAIADDLFKQQQYEKALNIYRQAAVESEKEKNNSNLVEALSQTARCFIATNKLQDGREWLDQAAQKADRNEPKGWSRFLSVRGRLEWKEEAALKKEVAPEASQAAATFQELYDYCLAYDFYERAIDAANMMSIVGRQEARIEWGLKGIDAAEKGKLESWLAPLWNNLGWNYEDMGDHGKALNALIKAREYHYKKDDEQAKLIADWSVGHAYRMAGNVDTAISIMTDVNNRAGKSYGKDSSSTNAEWLGFSCKELGELAILQGNKKAAHVHFLEAKKLLEIARIAEWDAKGYQELNEKIDRLESELK
jgi:tetratricopeptide (TPR) repeat protein